MNLKIIMFSPVSITVPKQTLMATLATLFTALKLNKLTIKRNPAIIIPINPRISTMRRWRKTRICSGVGFVIERNVVSI